LGIKNQYFIQQENRIVVVTDDLSRPSIILGEDEKNVEGASN